MNWRYAKINSPIPTLPLRRGHYEVAGRSSQQLIYWKSLWGNSKCLILIIKAKEWNVSETPFSDLAVLRKKLVAARFYLHSCNVRFQLMPFFFFFFKCPQQSQSHAHHKSAFCSTLVFWIIFWFKMFYMKCISFSFLLFICLLIGSHDMGWIMVFCYLKIKSHCESLHLYTTP